MPKYEAGDYIKVEFPDETGVGEWMWVQSGWHQLSLSSC